MTLRTLTAQELRGLRRSEYSRTWGDLDPEAMDALKAHVARRGVMHPATVRGREVVDGWHRIQAAIAVGQTCDVDVLNVDFPDEAIVELVTAENALRRNLLKSEAAEALARLRLQEDGTASATVAEDAALLGCSVRMVQRGRAVVRAQLGLATPPGGTAKAEAEAEAEDSGDPPIPQEPQGAPMSPPPIVPPDVRPDVPPQPQGVSSDHVPADIGDVVRHVVGAGELLAAMSQGTELSPTARAGLRAVSKIAAALPVEYRRSVTRDVACRVDGKELPPELVDGLRSVCDGCLRELPRETLLGVLRRETGPKAGNPAH